MAQENFKTTHTSGKDINLDEHPHATELYSGELTLGDLHANALKLIYHLIQQGILILQQGARDYQQLNALYKKDDMLTQEDIKVFKTILLQAIFEQHVHVRLLGDILADRGTNDYLVLCLLNVLQEKKVPFTILLSNHDAEFIGQYEKESPFSFDAETEVDAETLLFKTNITRECQDNSLQNMGKLMHATVGIQEEVIELVKDVYLPHLKLLDCTLEKSQKEGDKPYLTIFTHAPVTCARADLLDFIRELAEYFELPVPDFTQAESICSTINAINTEFSKLKDQKAIYQQSGLNVEKSYQKPAEGNCLMRIMWLRYKHLEEQESYLQEPAMPKGNYDYQGPYLVHGHDTTPYDFYPDHVEAYSDNLNSYAGQATLKVQQKTGDPEELLNYYHTQGHERVMSDRFFNRRQDLLNCSQQTL